MLNKGEEKSFAPLASSELHFGGLEKSPILFRSFHANNFIALVF